MQRLASINSTGESLFPDALESVLMPNIDSRTKLLDKEKVAHRIHSYDHDARAASYGDEAVESLADSSGSNGTRSQDARVKTDTGKLAVAVLPVPSKLSLKAAAAALVRARPSWPSSIRRGEVPRVRAGRIRRSASASASPLWSTRPRSRGIACCAARAGGGSRSRWLRRTWCGWRARWSRRSHRLTPPPRNLCALPLLPCGRKLDDDERRGPAVWVSPCPSRSSTLPQSYRRERRRQLPASVEMARNA